MIPKDLLPEEWEELVKRFQLTKQENIERFGGSVEWLTKKGPFYPFEFIGLKMSRILAKSLIKGIHSSSQ